MMSVPQLTCFSRPLSRKCDATDETNFENQIESIVDACLTIIHEIETGAYAMTVGSLATDPADAQARSSLDQ
jgi:hypothetical protein